MSMISVEEALVRAAEAVKDYSDRKISETLSGSGGVGGQKLPITLGAFQYGTWGGLEGNTVEQKAQHLARYDVIVYQGALSNDLTMSSANYQRDLALYIKALEYNPDLKVFGYVTARGFANSKSGGHVGMTEYRTSPDNVDHPIWTKEELCAYIRLMAHCGGTKSTTEVDEYGNPVITGGIPLYGVYYDDYDYNFTNDNTHLINQGDWQSIREKHNFLIDYAHSLGLSNMPNSNPYLVFDNEPTPNSFTNPEGIPSHMNENDWFSLESYFLRSDYTFGASDHYASDYNTRYRDTYKSKCLALTYIYAVSDDAKDNHQIASTFAVIQAMCQGVDSIALQGANFSHELPENLTKYYDKNNNAVYSGSNGNYSLTVNGYTITASRSTALTAYGKEPNASALSTCKVIADGRIFNNIFVEKDELAYMFSTVEQNVDEKIKDLKETIADSTNLYHRAFIDDWEEVYTLDDYTNYCFTFQNSTFGNGEGSGSTLTWSAENPYDFKMRVPANGAYRRIEMDARHLAGKTVELGFKSLDVYLEDSPSTKPKLHFYIYCTCESGSNQNLAFTLDTRQKSCIDGVNRWCQNITFAEDLQSLRITIQRMSASPAGAWIVDATGSYMVETNEHPVKKTWFTNYAPSLSAGFLLNTVTGMGFVIDEDGDGVTINYSSTAAVNNQFRVKVPADANILKVGETWEIGVKEFYAYDDDGNDVTNKCQLMFSSTSTLGINLYGKSSSYYKNDMASKLNRPLICMSRATVTANGMPESNLIIKTTNNVGGSTREDGSANYYHIVVKGFYLYRIDESEELFIRGEDPSDTLIGINRVKTDTIDEKLAPNTLHIVDNGTMFITDFKGRRIDLMSSSIDVTAEVGQTIIVKEVDANGKPTKWESAEYQPRTHWSEEVEMTIVPQVTFEPIYNQAFGIPMYSLNKFEVVVGKVYTVIYDGVQYNCTAKAGTFNGMSFIGIGNEAFVGGENNDMPFVVTMITDMDMNVVACLDMDGHTIEVIGDATMYHKIPKEYVQDNDFLVEIGHGMQGLVLYTNPEDITNAILSDKNIRATVKVGMGHIGGDEYVTKNYFTLNYARTFESGQLQMAFGAAGKMDGIDSINGSAVKDVFPYGDLILIWVESDGNIVIETPNMPNQ